LPIDVMKSDWLCTLEPVSSFKFQVSGNSPESSLVIPSETGCPLSGQPVESRDLLFTDNRPKLTLRLGLRYVRGLREEAGRALVRARNVAPLDSIHDLTHHVPELRKDELSTLAEIGALNSIGHLPRRHEGAEKQLSQGCARISTDSINHQQTIMNHSSFGKLHRRDALWQVERACRRTGPLLETIDELDRNSPLDVMTSEERLVADFHGTGLTVGPHPMAYYRDEMNSRGILRAIDLAGIRNGTYVRVAGAVIARQRPGTAKGFVFLSLEDETGISNAIITPDIFQQHRFTVIEGKFLLIEGRLQNIDNVISVKADRVEVLPVSEAAVVSHDFH